MRGIAGGHKKIKLKTQRSQSKGRKSGKDGNLGD